MSHEEYNPEASKKKRHNLNLLQSSNGSHQPSEKQNKKGAKKKILLYALEARQLVDFHQLQLLNKWHPSIILFLSGSHL